MKPGQVEKHNNHWICQLSETQGREYIAKIYKQARVILYRSRGLSEKGLGPFIPIAQFRVKPSWPNNLPKPIDNVTTTNLDMACRAVGMYINKTSLDHIIDLVELIEDKGDEVSIMDITKLQAEWRSHKQSKIEQSWKK